MRTWGDIRNSVLAKLDLPAEEADKLGYMNRIPIYANEAMTQICSTVKPKREFVTFEVWDKKCKIEIWDYLRAKYNVFEDELVPVIKIPTNDNQINFYNEWSRYKFTDELIEVGEFVVFSLGEIRTSYNFVSFNDDVPTVQKILRIDNWYIVDSTVPFEAHDSDFEYKGYNKIICKHPGIYIIPYNARWFTFDTSSDEPDLGTVINVPDDVIDCIPSYVVSQLFKIDDEYKASVYRNEYEMFLARIDNTDYRNSKTIEIGGDW